MVLLGGDLPACLPKCMWGFGDVTVAGGRFTATSAISPMISGSYTVEITMGAALTQPENVQAVIGKHGENLRGPWIVTLDENGKYIPVRFPRSAEPSYLEPFIRFAQRIEVAGDPSSDIAAKTQAIADQRQWSVKSCTSVVDVTNAMVGSGASTGHLILGEERQATIDKCIADNESHLRKALQPKASGLKTFQE